MCSASTRFVPLGASLGGFARLWLSRYRDKMSCECPLVFSYVDYRRYLADYYAHAKKCHYGFSFRVFSKRAEISSSNYLRLVIDGKRNLTSEPFERCIAHYGKHGRQGRLLLRSGRLQPS